MMPRTGRPRTKARLAPLALAATLALLVLAACGGEEAAEEPAAEEPAAGETAAETAAEGEGEAAAGADCEDVTLRAISFLPGDHPYVDSSFPLWQEAVQSATNGSVTIEYAGGPEAIPTEEQFGAVRSGVADVGFNVATFYVNEVPGGNFMFLSPFTTQEERDGGFFEFLERIHGDAGVKYLGRWLSVAPFYVWTDTEVTQLEDLRGLRLRSVPTYHHLFEEVGVRPVTLLPADAYSALERGIVDGFGWPLLGALDFGWTDFVKNVMNEPYFNQNGAILVNPDRWEGLCAEQQEQIVQATDDFEEEMVQSFLDVNAAEKQRLDDAGVQFDELPQAEAEQWANLWYERTWEVFGEPADPAVVEEAKEILQFDEVQGNLDRIRAIPCAGAGAEADVQEGCIANS